MPRQPRQFEIGNIYHIINRGVEARDIFLKNQDYSRFILGLEFFNNTKEIDLWGSVFRAGAIGGSDPPMASIIQRLKKERGRSHEPIVDLMVFALMPNHYHLILREIRRGGISLFMQKIGGYSTYFNKQNNRQGSLFQSRYRCVEIKSDAQLFAVFAYVHTNPIGLIEPMWKNQQVKDFNKAKDFLKNYKWSSYKDHIGGRAFPNVTNRKFFMELLGGKKGCQKEIEDWIKFKAENYMENNKLE